MHFLVFFSAGNDDEMMLCDHCDANHHIYCLRPPLSKVRFGHFMVLAM